MNYIHSILNSLFDGIVVINKDYKIIFANKTFVDICGFKAEDIIGKNCYDIFHRHHVPCSLVHDGKRSLLDTKPAFICPLKEVRSKKLPVAVTHIHYCINSDEKTFSVHASPVMDEGGEVKEMIAIWRDITDKEKAITEEKRCHTFLESILASIGEGVIVIGRDYKIISANKSYLMQTKNSLNNIIGSHCYEVSHHYDKPCYEKGEECPVKHTFETGEHCRVMHTHYEQKGNPIYVEINSYPIRNPKGSINLVIETIADITQRSILESDLKKRVKELEEFYTMAVGRELRMVELKQEIERLNEELKKHKGI